MTQPGIGALALTDLLGRWPTADGPLYRLLATRIARLADIGELPAGLRRAVRSVTAPSPDQVTLHLAGGITVLWGGTDRAAAKARELTALMQTHLRYYDVSAPGSATAK